jgi:hypothetical protein|tara:strand:+ start:591 stop:992 length:402 start_codon:yes stop_codon:yes gene_type:complete
MKKSPLNFFGGLAGIGNSILRGSGNDLTSSIFGRGLARKNNAGSQNAIMTKLNEISNKLGSNAPAQPVSSAPQNAGTTGVINSAADVSPTMINPTEVNEGLMGDNEVVKDQSALMKIKKYKGKCKVKNKYKKK